VQATATLSTEIVEMHEAEAKLDARRGRRGWVD